MGACTRRGGWEALCVQGCACESACVHTCVCVGVCMAVFVAMWGVWATVVWHALHRRLFRPLMGNWIPGFWLGCLVGFISVSVPTRGLSNGNI